MKKKVFNLLFCSLIISIFILSIYLILAAAAAPIDLIINNNVTVLYDEGNFFVNWTSGGGGEAEGNYTVHLWKDNQYVNATANANNSVTGYTFGTSVEANYTFTIAAVNSTNNDTNSTMNVSMYVDSTAPPVNWTSSGYNNVTYKKNTSKLTLNISVGDALSGVGSGNSYCVFNINGTNETVLVSSGWCNTTQLNLTGLGDGNQTIDIWVNDTVNNVGVNISSYVVWTDTTVPTATFTCSPTSVNSGATVTCTCTGTDTGVGVNSSLTTAAATITTNSTLGTFTTTDNCTITDYAGNTHNDTTTYTVTSDAVSGGSFSSGGTKWTGTYVITDNQFKEGYTKSLEVKKRVKFKVGSADHYLGLKELTETTAKIEVSSVPQEATLFIGESIKFDIDGDGYYDVWVTLNSILDKKADITLKFINELIIEDLGGEEQIEEDQKTGEAESFTEEEGSFLKQWWFWLVVILVVLGIWYYFKRKNNIYKIFSSVK